MGTEIRTLRILADRGGEEPPRFAAQELTRYLVRMRRVCVIVEEVFGGFVVGVLGEEFAAEGFGEYGLIERLI